MFGETGRYAGGARDAERQCARSRFDKERIRVAVIATFELDDLIAARMTPRQPNRAHCCLGARIDHAHTLDRRYQCTDSFSNLRLEETRCAKTESLFRSFDDRVDYARMAMAKDHWAP